MDQTYGDFSYRRLNKSGMLIFLIAGIIAIAFIVIDAFWANGIMSLPTVFEIPYQIIYLLWFAFIIFGLGVDKVTISESSVTVSLFFAKKQEIEKSALAYALEIENRIYFVSIVDSLKLENGPKDEKSLKSLNGVISIPTKFRDKALERGYQIESR